MEGIDGTNTQTFVWPKTSEDTDTQSLVWPHEECFKMKVHDYMDTNNNSSSNPQQQKREVTESISHKYKCNVCELEYLDNNELISHKRQQHCCNVCNYIALDSNDLTKH